MKNEKDVFNSFLEGEITAIDKLIFERLKDDKPIEVKKIELSDGSFIYDVQFTIQNFDNQQITICCTSKSQACNLKKILDEAISIELS